MEKSRGTRSGRIASVIAVAVASLVAFASLGGAGLAQSAVGLAQYQYGKKVTICHKGKRTIRISVRAWPAHKRHGDTEGACANVVKHAKKHHKAEHAGKANAKAGKSHGKKAEQASEAVAQKAEGSGKANGKSNGKGRNK